MLNQKVWSEICVIVCIRAATVDNYLSLSLDSLYNVRK